MIKIIVYTDRKNKFVEIFNANTGFYVRSGVMKDGKDTGLAIPFDISSFFAANHGESFVIRGSNHASQTWNCCIDPFMRNFPQLIDVGIMGSCVHGSSGLCLKSGIECYQNGLKTKKPNMSLENFKKIVNQCKGKSFQFALGGRGDVDQHENCEEILRSPLKTHSAAKKTMKTLHFHCFFGAKVGVFRGGIRYCRESGIVPNFTTSGLGLTQEIVDMCKRYVGAIAISWYRAEHTYKAIDMLVQSKVKTNIHYVLGNNTIDEAIERLEAGDFPEGINAVIFLMHKPVGLGSEGNVMNADDPRVSRFFEIVNSNKFDFKIGFDSCSCAGIVNFTDSINLDSIDYCEGSRHSCYIDAQMNMMPCSFANDDNSWFVNLNDCSIEEAWNSEVFDRFRFSLKNSCGECKDRLCCGGGCPIVNQITLCSRKERDFKCLR